MRGGGLTSLKSGPSPAMPPVDCDDKVQAKAGVTALHSVQIQMYCLWQYSARKQADLQGVCRRPDLSHSMCMMRAVRHSLWAGCLQMHAELHADAIQAGVLAGGSGREAGTESEPSLWSCLPWCMDMTPPNACTCRMRGEMS